MKGFARAAASEFAAADAEGGLGPSLNISATTGGSLLVSMATGWFGFFALGKDFIATSDAASCDSSLASLSMTSSLTSPLSFST